MPEDKLTHDERLRLECLAQSIAYHGMRTFVVPVQIVATAAVYEDFIRNGIPLTTEHNPTN